MTLKMKSEEMFRPIDLESSLGRIEDDKMSDADEMDLEPPSTRTCEQSPFDREEKQEPFAPYPIMETHDEIRERQRLGESVGKFLPPQYVGGKQVDWVPEDLEPVEDPGDDDDFSLASHEEDSLKEEDQELEKIEDRVSFWEFDQTYNFVPNVSFSSHAASSSI